MRQHIILLDVSIGMTVICVSGPPREHSEHERKCSGVNVWCALTHLNTHQPDFIWGHPYKQFIPRHVGKLCSSAPQQHQEKLILQLDGAPLHCAHIVHDCMKVNFPGRCIGRGGPIAWALPSPDLMSLDFLFLRGYRIEVKLLNCSCCIVSYLHCFQLVSFIACVVLCAVFCFEKQLTAVKWKEVKWSEVKWSEVIMC
jgi:hypothetical protein